MSVIPHPDPVPASAEEWLARRKAPRPSAQDEAAFQSWLAADPRHAAEYEECERFWSIAAGVRERPDLTGRALRAARVGRGGFRSWLWTGALASAAGLAALGWFLIMPAGTFLNAGAIKTARGEQRAVTLEDGSMVQLNTDTLFVARIDATERRVELLRGEAFFDVARDPARPFVVRAGSSEVRVVGTQFSVREAAGKLEVVVREGMVNVIPDVAAAARTQAHKVELVPGHRLRYDNALRVVKVAVVDPERTLLWRKGLIELDSTPLQEAVEEVNRYSRVPIAIEDPHLAGVRVSGGFKVGDTEAFLFFLKERLKVQVERRPDLITLRTL